jgi:hypothetical protein
MYHLGIEMNTVYMEMQDSISDFNEDRSSYNSTLDENTVESI